MAGLGGKLQQGSAAWVEPRSTAGQPRDEPRHHEHQHGETEREVYCWRVLQNLWSAFAEEPGDHHANRRQPMQYDHEFRVTLNHVPPRLSFHRIVAGATRPYQADTHLKLKRSVQMNVALRDAASGMAK
jgi:hypothetical protein